jgi:uncharacterized membrane protein
MKELIVFAFDTETGADEMATAVQELQEENIITLEDAAVVVRPEDGKPKVKQAQKLVGAGALGGAFWGMLIGMVFMMPWLGLALGAVTGAIAGKKTDLGIDDDFIERVSESIEPGGSALFLMIADATSPDIAIERLSHFDATILRTSLSTEDEANLREAFGVHDED